MPQFVRVPISEFDPKAAYDLLVSTVAPRPIAFVSTLGTSGVPNLAPFSFFMAGGSNPPSLMISSTLSSRGLPKDTLRNVRETGEFVVNTVHRPMAEGMSRASASLSVSHSEWEIAGFTPLPSEIVRPARVAESLVQFECRLFEIVEHGHGPSSANYIIGEVVLAHIAAELWDADSQTAKPLLAIARMGGPDYLDAETLEYFAIER